MHGSMRTTMQELCLIHAWTVLIHAWTVLIHAWTVHDTCMNCAWFCIIHAWTVHIIGIIFTRIMHKLCLEYAWKGPECACFPVKAQFMEYHAWICFMHETCMEPTWKAFQILACYMHVTGFLHGPRMVLTIVDQVMHSHTGQFHAWKLHLKLSVRCM